MPRRKMDRLMLVPLSEVLPRVNLTARRKNAVPRQLVRGIKVFLSSRRLQVSASKGVACVLCGIEGVYFSVERSDRTGPFHLNLYAINDEGEEVLMTKDHIIPRSRGGTNGLDNLQPMCVTCNRLKGNRIEQEEATVAWDGRSAHAGSRPLKA